jgi:predicted O-methyltransferase YrrM
MHKKLIELASKMGQATEVASSNLGFGYLYYGLARIYRPDVVVCIGSYRGFAPICFALGLVDNQKGSCYFIDPGKVDSYWHNPHHILYANEAFGLQGRWRHILKTSQQVAADGDIKEPVDILLIDGDHSYEGVGFDFNYFTPKVRSEGIILLHDSITEGRGFTKWEVKKFLKNEIENNPKYETFTFSFSAGLTLIRKVG